MDKGGVPPKKGFLQGLRDLCTKHGTILIFDEVITGFRLGFTGAQGYIYFTGTEVVDYETAKTSDTAMYGRYFHHMLEHGIHLASAQFEAMFLSAAHTKGELAEVLEIMRGFFGGKR